VARFYSQHGEDAQLAAHFSRKTHGFFVEVGALDGITLSNTYFFERELGWSGILVEANPSEAKKCAAARPHSTVIQAAVVAPDSASRIAKFQVVKGEEGLSTLEMQPRYRDLVSQLSAAREQPLSIVTIEVPTTTLDEILSRHARQTIDFMTIDIEGHEAAALRGLALGRRWRPQVLLIESTTVWPEIRVIGRLFRAGYAYRRTIVINDWFEPAGTVVCLVAIGRMYLYRVPRSVRAARRSVFRRLGLLDTAQQVRSAIRQRLRDRRRQ
jgi:FkbM family methyltransferase